MIRDQQGTPVPSARNSLGLDGAQYERLLARLDELGAESPCPSPERVFRRLPYAHLRVRLVVEQDGHSGREFVVATRNISQGGVSILHSNFMYPGSRVRLELIRVDKTTRACTGTVSRCEHRGGVLHEIGIAFDKEIRIREYIRPDAATLMHARERVDPDDLSIRVLVLAPDEAFRAAARQIMLPTNIEYSVAERFDASAHTPENADVIVCHGGFHAQDAVRTITDIRVSGFRGPVVLVATARSETEACMMRACGADMVLPDPIDERTLMCALGEYVYTEWTPEALETVRSCIDPRSVSLLSAEVARLGVRLDQCARTDDAEGVQSVCERLRLVTPMIGLGILGRAAQSVQDRSGAEGLTEVIRAEIGELASGCVATGKRAAA